MNMKERMEVIKACKYVDDVISSAPLNLDKYYIEKYNISTIVTCERPSEELELMYNIPIKIGW